MKSTNRIAVLTARANRREFLRSAGLFTVAAALPAFSSSAKAAPGYMSSTDKTEDLIYMSATKLAQLIREKKISSVELTKAY
ncbi:MAG TPA: hypothetical protein VIN06_11130, partial [Devosia sp.]